MSTGMQKARVAIIHGTLDIGGSENQSLLLARYMHERLGSQVEIWGLHRREGSLSAKCKDLNLVCRACGLPFPGQRSFLPLHSLYLSRMIRRHAIEVLMPYTTRPNVIAGIAWKFTHARAMIWNQRDIGLESHYRIFEKRALLNATRIISNSRAGAHHLADKHKIEQSKIELIHNGIATMTAPDCHRNWREILNVSKHRLVVTMIGNLSPHKDHETLLRAWAMVIKACADNGTEPPLLLLAGRKDSAYQALSRLSLDLEIVDHVRFLGFVPEIQSLLKSSDIAVFSSVSEGLPNGVLEPMAAGLPLVATDIPGVREAMGEHGPNLLSPTRNAGSLTANILFLLGDARLRNEIGERNKERMFSEFSTENMCERTSRVISECLRRN